MKKFIIFLALSLPSIAAAQYTAEVRQEHWWWQFNGNEWEGELFADLYDNGQLVPDNPSLSYKWFYKFPTWTEFLQFWSAYYVPRQGIVTGSFRDYKVEIYQNGVLIATSPVLRITTPEAAKLVTLSGILENGNPAYENKISVWSFPQNWHPTKEGGGSGELFPLTLDALNTLWAHPDVLTSPVERYHRWEKDDEQSPLYVNHDEFIVQSTTTEITSYYNSFVTTTTIKTELIDGGAGGNVEFRDPWLIDDSSDPKGDRNRGQAAALWYSQPSPFSPNTATNYMGVFLDQSPITEPAYYSVRVPQSQSINGFTWTFREWVTQNATLSTPNNLVGGYYESPVIFTSSSSPTVTARYKANRGSSSATATAGNGQRKLVKGAGANEYYLVYESTGEVWYTKTTDGTNWNAEQRLSAGNGSNTYPSIAIRGSNLYVVWQRKNGSTYDVFYRDFTSGVWNAAQTLGTGVGSSDPLPVIVASSHGSQLMLVYRGASGLKYRFYTGSSWQSAATVTGTTSASRNPSIGYNEDWNIFALTWDNGSQVYHQYFNGSSWSSPYQVSQVASAYGHQYSSYAVSENLDQHIVWQAFDAVLYQRQVIYYNRNLNPTIYTLFASEDWDFLRPTGSGHSNAGFSVVWHDASSNKNIRKATSNGSSWQDGQLGTVLASNSADASLSVADPPGATAKAVWRSTGNAPFMLTLGPSGGLGKSAASETVVYNRRAVYSSGKTAELVLQMGNAEIVAGGSKIALAFPAVNDDDTLAVGDLAGKLSLSSVLLPANADSVLFDAVIYSNDAGALRIDPTLPQQVNFDFVSAANGTSLLTVPVASVSASGKYNFTSRLAVPVKSLAGQILDFVPVLTNLNVATVRGALVHVYELDSEGRQQSKNKPLLATRNASSQDFGLSMHPNPFNPATELRFQLPVAGTVRLAIYDILGKQVKLIVDGRAESVEQRHRWLAVDEHGAAVSSGVYFAVLEARLDDGRTLISTQKLMYIR